MIRPTPRFRKDRWNNRTWWPAESAVRLVGVMRQTEMLQKAIAMSTEMNKEALQEVARVGGRAVVRPSPVTKEKK